MKRNKLAKVMALLLAACMLLSACGAQKEEEKQSSQSTSSASKSEADASSEAEEPKAYWEMLDEVSDSSELPDWDGETLEINIWYAGGTAKHEGYFDVTEDNVYYKEIERVTGIKINWDECFDNGGNNVDAKLPMVVASGDMPTIIAGHDIANQMAELYKNGYLVNLTEYYEKGYLDAYTEYWYPMDVLDAQIYSKLRTEDGEYYLIQSSSNGVGSVFAQVEAAGYELAEYDETYWNTYYTTPQNRLGYGNGNGVTWVRDDILKALYPTALTMDEIEDIYMSGEEFTEDQIYDIGLETMDDFVEFLRDVQELVATGDYVDKNGNQVKVTYGPHTETDNWTYGTVLPSFIQGMTGFDYFSYLDRDATEASEYIKRTIDCEEYVDYLKNMNILVREDIISQDSMLDNSAMQEEKILNHSYAVTYFNLMNGEKGQGDGYRYRPIWVKCQVGEEVQAVKASALSSYMGICGEDLSDEEIEQIIHMINYTNSPVGLKCQCWGPASAGLFTEDAEGNRTFTNQEVAAYLLKGEGDGEIVKKLGLHYSAGSFDAFSFASGNTIIPFRASYQAAINKEKTEADAWKYFSSGVLQFEKDALNDRFMASCGIDIYGTGQAIEGLQTFWKARAGFEDQMKKVLVAEDDAAFEAQLTKLREYADTNSYTTDTMKEFSEWWAERNETNLKAAGKLK